MKTWNKLQFTVCTLAFVAIMSACGNKAPATSSSTSNAANASNASTAANPPAVKLTKLKIGVLKMAALMAPYIAKQQGIFAKNGLDVFSLRLTL